MNEIYQDTLNHALQTQILVPLTMDCTHLMNSLTLLTGYERVDTSIEQSTLDSVNRMSILLLMKAVKTLEEYLFLEWRCTPDFIEQTINTQLNKYMNALKCPQFIRLRMDQGIEQILGCYKKVHDNTMELIETLITQLCDDYLCTMMITQNLSAIIETQMHRVAYDLFDFAYINNPLVDDLTNQIQSLFVRITEQFFNYQVTVSYYANYRMEYLDQVMSKYQVMANPNNYKYMQKEVSHDVIGYAEQLLATQCFDLYPTLSHKVAKQSIKHFYYLIDEEIQWFNYDKPAELEYLINSANFKVIKPMPQNIQVIQEPLNFINLLPNALEVMVLTSQEVINQDNHGLFIEVVYRQQQSKYIINLNYHYLMFHQYFNGWVEQGEVKTINNNLLEFINSEFDYLHQGCPDIRKRITSERSVDREINEAMAFQNAVFKFKKISAPKKPIRYGTRVNMVAGKALGAGIGCLIVDCLDEDIPWDEKFKNAGLTTVSLGMLGLMASRLPVIGLLIQQVILVYAVKLILDNKVISDTETSKNLGHLGVTVGIGVGLTIAGSILFPIGFWGAFFGGLAGGIGMGLYSKFVIPYAMENLVEMITQTSVHLRRSGVVRFRKSAVKKMKCDQLFFDKHRPSNLSEDDFFTLLMTCLVNESKGVAKGQYERVLQKLKKKESENGLLILEMLERQIQIQAKLDVWDICQKYLVKQKIQMLSNAEVIAQFVDGMLVNFKIQ